jgi:hypothetical protein
MASDNSRHNLTNFINNTFFIISCTLIVASDEEWVSVQVLVAFNEVLVGWTLEVFSILIGASDDDWVLVMQVLVTFGKVLGRMLEACSLLVGALDEDWVPGQVLVAFDEVSAG